MREDQEVHQFKKSRNHFVEVGGGDSLERYFSERLLAPVKEWQKEATTNKAFYLGEKSFEYISTVAGHEPAINFPTE